MRKGNKNYFRKKMNMILGATGTLGAGKGKLVDILVENYGFVHYSVRAFLISEIESRELPVNRDSMRDVANDLRAKFHSSFIIETLYKQAKEAGGNAIIESVRNIGEVDFLNIIEDFKLVAIDANLEIRYHRVAARQSETDHVDFETFKRNEQEEWENTDHNKQNLKACIEMADYTLINNGTEKQFERKVAKMVRRLG